MYENTLKFQLVCESWGVCFRGFRLILQNWKFVFFLQLPKFALCHRPCANLNFSFGALVVTQPLLELSKPVCICHNSTKSLSFFQEHPCPSVHFCHMNQNLGPGTLKGHWWGTKGCIQLHNGQLSAQIFLSILHTCNLGNWVLLQT